jgi:hypothetical protein
MRCLGKESDGEAPSLRASSKTGRTCRHLSDRETVPSIGAVRLEKCPVYMTIRVNVFQPASLR